MRAQAQPPAGLRGVSQLLDRPFLSFGRLAPHRLGREAVERRVIGGVDRNQLALQMGRQFGDRDARLGAAPGQIVAIILAFGGQLQVALVDLRPESPTFGLRNTLYIGTLRPWQVIIPPGVGHGYKVIGPDPAILVYLTDRFYDPSDEGRIPYNDPQINYDWETQHK